MGSMQDLKSDDLDWTHEFISSCVTLNKMFKFPETPIPGSDCAMKTIVVIFPLQSSCIDYINLLLRKWFCITWMQKEGLTLEWLRPYWIAMPPLFLLSPGKQGEQTGLRVLKSIIREEASREHGDTSNELMFSDPGNLLSRWLEDIGAVIVEPLSVIKTAANWDIQSRLQLLTVVPIKRTWGPQ